MARIPWEVHECAICGRLPGRFLPYRGGRRNRPPLMVALKTVGSDVENFSCPWCGAHDRERHLFLYMRESGLLQGITGQRVLHFAPEPQLSRLIREAGPSDYIRCDLFPWADDILQADLLSLPFPNDHFDLLLANHVLEHVADDQRVVHEIARVLKPGGHAILQTPYSSVLEATWEDPGVRSPEARRQAFGQEDHVRLFGRDIFSRIVNQGLEPLVRQHWDALPACQPQRHGVNPREPFFLFRKAPSLPMEASKPSKE